MKLDPPCNRGESREEESSPAGRRRNRLRCRVATTDLDEAILNLGITTLPKLGQDVVRQSMLLSRASIVEEFRAPSSLGKASAMIGPACENRRQPIGLYLNQIVTR